MLSYDVIDSTVIDYIKYVSNILHWIVNIQVNNKNIRQQSTLAPCLHFLLSFLASLSFLRCAPFKVSYSISSCFSLFFSVQIFINLLIVLYFLCKPYEFYCRLNSNINKVVLIFFEICQCNLKIILNSGKNL